MSDVGGWLVCLLVLGCGATVWLIVLSYLAVLLGRAVLSLRAPYPWQSRRHAVILNYRCPEVNDWEPLPLPWPPAEAPTVTPETLRRLLESPGDGAQEIGRTHFDSEGKYRA